MTEVFSAIRFEYAGRAGGWTDFTADVLKTPSPRVSGMGITGTGFTDRVGDAGTLTFSLDNSASNSQATLGYYTNFARGSYVRLSFEYDNRRVYKFVGTVDVDGVKAIAGKYGPRRVDVRCTNWMGLAAAHQLNLVGYQTNKRYDEVMPMLLQNMGDQPFGMLFDQGQETFPTVFDVTRTQTKTLGEFQKLAYSELGRIYMRGDFTNGGQLYGEARNSRQLHDTNITGTNAEWVPVLMSSATDTLFLMATGDLTLMSTGAMKLNQRQRAILTEADVMDLKFSYIQNYFNRALARSYPRTVDAAATSVLGSLSSGSYITLTAGQQITDYRLQYNDPNNPDVKINGIEMRQPISSTDYKMYANSDATGTDYTTSLSIQVRYGTSEASYTLTNNAAVTAYVTTLQAVGKGVRIYNTTDKVYTSILPNLSNTTVQIEFDMPYTNPNTTTGLFAYDTGNWNAFFTGYDYQELNAIEAVTFLANRSSLNMFAFMYCEPGTEIRFDETISGVGVTANPYFINGTSFEIIQGKYVKWTASCKWNGRY